MKNALYVLLVVLLILFWRDWAAREITHPPGVLVPAAPKQQNLVDGQALHLDGYRLTPRAAFDIEARVLSTKNYRWGSESDLSPLDFALGWGVMSDQAVLDRIEISQASRWYFTRYELPAPISDQEIISNSSNMHLIPANDWVRRKLKTIRRGNILQMKGSLVDVDNESGFKWHTSMRRDDTGNGSCEVFYVEEVYVQ